MKKTIWTFGLIAGVVLSVMMVVTIPFVDRIGFDAAMIIGYASMVAAFLAIYFGIRSYRDNVLGGTISFGRSFGVGMLIAVVATLCYVATWQVVYRTTVPDFWPKWTAYEVEKARADGKSEAEIEEIRADGVKYAEMYKNPLVNSAFTFLETMPVALIITLVSAATLSRRKRLPDGAAASA
jgi:hypothetical protein